ncbi:MAG: exonuclease domain-containing protein [Candidatus Omnitrophota bacterium]
MTKNINEIEFAVFDVETTGLEPELGDRIVEVGAIRLKGREVLGTFHSLINPGKRAISPAAYAVNQITTDMLKDAPDTSEVLPKFLDFISSSCLAAYNAPFDFGFLTSELKLINRGLAEELQIVDVLIMAKRILPGLERYALWFVAEKLGINTIQEHRAFSDVRLTVEIFNRLNSMVIQKGVVDFEQFISLFGLNSQLLNNINNLKIARIQEALDLGVSLMIKYLSERDAEITEREVIPREIIRNKNRIYLVGYCNLRKEERTFKIANILHLQMQTPIRLPPHLP